MSITVTPFTTCESEKDLNTLLVDIFGSFSTAQCIAGLKIYVEGIINEDGGQGREGGGPPSCNDFVPVECGSWDDFKTLFLQSLVKLPNGSPALRTFIVFLNEDSHPPINELGSALICGENQTFENVLFKSFVKNPETGEVGFVVFVTGEAGGE